MWNRDDKAQISTTSAAHAAMIDSLLMSLSAVSNLWFKPLLKAHMTNVCGPELNNYRTRAFCNPNTAKSSRPKQDQCPQTDF